MNKTALVTLWVDPAEHQIVKYTFDNVWMDFLPGAWLVNVDDIRASMTMGQPFPGVWLPRELNIHAGITLAMGSFEAAYARRFSDYKEADVKTRIRIPKRLIPPSDRRAGPAFESNAGARSRRALSCRTRIQQQPKSIAEIRVHGNAYLRDEEVIRLAGISVGQPLAPDGIAAIRATAEGQRRLRQRRSPQTLSLARQLRLTSR